MSLSLRLQKIADFVPEGGTMADVGTDHGQLPVYLVKAHKIERAIAMDVRSGPLSRAEETIRKYGCGEQIELRLADGLSALRPGEAGTVVIAGMGGALIRKILEEGRHMWDFVEHWILSPQSEIGETRHWLEQHGFSILKEDMVLDGGKYYVVMDVIRGFMHYDQEYEYTYGRNLIQEGNPVLKEYLELEKEKLQALMGRLKEQQENADAKRCAARMEELREKERQADHALKAFSSASESCPFIQGRKRTWI